MRRVLQRTGDEDDSGDRELFLLGGRKSGDHLVARHGAGLQLLKSAASFRRPATSPRGGTQRSRV